MLLVQPDSNGILQEPMKNCTVGEMIQAYQCLIDQLKSSGITPKHHILDNECSEEFKATIKKNNMTYQLVPPHNHQRNLTEKAIQTFKAHFKNILCGTDTNFPLHPQGLVATSSRAHPQHVTMIHGHTNSFSIHIFLGATQLQRKSYRTTWLQGGSPYHARCTRDMGCPHSKHIGNAWEHYRCHEVYISSTKCTRISETIFFRHKYLTMPTITPADALIKAADNLVDAILDHLPKNSVTADAVKQLIEIYKIQADQATCAARAQRVLREQALAQRVDEEQQAVVPVQVNHQHTSTTFPNFEVDDNQANDPRATCGPSVISQDEDSLPAANTRKQRQT